MTQGPEQAPAGWYADPHAPERMRYFDGREWTNHFHQPGKLPDIGNWIGTTFSVFGRYWKGAALLAFGATLLAGIVTWLGIRLLIDDIAIVNEEFVNVGSGTLIGFLVIIVLALIAQGFSWIALSRYLHRAHFSAAPTVGDALEHGLRRLPRYIAVTFGLALAIVCISVLLALVLFAVPVLGLLVVPAMIVGIVWGVVKLAFYFVAVAVAPASDSALGASAEVSRGRFWGVLGRLLLLFIAVAIAGQILAVAMGDYGQVVDADVLSEVLVVVGDTVEVRDFRLVDVLPSTGEFVLVLVLNSILQGATALVTTSALVRLYLDAGAPSEDL